MQHSKFSRTALSLLAATCVAPALVAQTPLYTFNGTGGDQLGRSVAPAGDVNNDGFDDVIVGSPLDDPSGANSGKAVVFSGKTGSALLILNGLAAGDEFGYAVDGIGDIDHDGYDDIAVGAPGNDSAGIDSGMVRAYSGHTGAWLFEWFGTAAGDRFGHAVAGAGDVNNNGYADIIIGAPFEDYVVSPTTIHTDGGTARVYSGKTGQLLIEKLDWNAGDLMGWSVDGIGDVDDDNSDDIIIGAPFGDYNGHAAGWASVYSGADGSWINTVYGNNDGDRMGTSVAGLGDCDNDVHPDYAIGGPYCDINGPDSGIVLVISGLNEWVMHNKQGPAGSHFGASVAGIGDVDNDGRNDFLVGAPKYDFFSSDDVGLVQVFSGDLGNAIYSLLGSHADDELGDAVASAGDINSDGTPDIVAGAPTADSNGTNSGYARTVLMDAPQPTAYCTAKTNSLGCVPHIGYSGVPSVHTMNTFHVTASNVRNNKAGMLFWGLQQSGLPFHGGTICVLPPFIRTGAQSSGGTGSGDDCTGNYDFFFSQSYMSAVGLQAGHTVKAQYWSRDPGFAWPNNVGLTNAISFEVLN